MSTPQSAGVVVAALALFVIFSTQVMLIARGRSSLPARIRSVLAPNDRPEPGLGRTIALLFAWGFVALSQLPIILLLLWKLAELNPASLLLLGLEVSLAGLWAVYLIESRRNPSKGSFR